MAKYFEMILGTNATAAEALLLKRGWYPNLTGKSPLPHIIPGMITEGRIRVPLVRLLPLESGSKYCFKTSWRQAMRFAHKFPGSVLRCLGNRPL